MPSSDPPAAPSGITPRQQLVIDAIATGLPITRVAETTGVARKTIYNWLENRAFQEALASRRRELAERVADRVDELGQACITTVLDYLGSDAKGEYHSPARVDLAKELIEKMGLLGNPRPERRKPEAGP